ELESKDQYGRTPLLRAAKNGHEAVVRLLVELGADVNARSNDGWMALRWAAENGHEAVVRLLLERGAGVNVKSNNGWT
ncbi:ankyrin, partial [Zopfia rhizophila CBS 207.26]